MKIRLTIVQEYDTGDERETLNNYETTDPEECLSIDRDNIKMLGIADFLELGDFGSSEATYTLEVVPAEDDNGDIGRWEGEGGYSPDAG